MNLEIKQHDDGTYYARPYMGYNKVTGKPWRPYKRFPEAVDEAEALEMARDWVSTLSGAAGLGASMRLVDVLTRYIELNAQQWGVNTVKTYTTCLQAWIKPNVADIELDEFRPHIIEALYNVLMIRGSVRTGGPLSPTTVSLVHSFLCGAFKWIVAREVAPFDPMLSVRKPRTGTAEAPALAVEDFARLYRGLTAAMEQEEDFMRRMTAIAAYIALNTGMRCGEVCGLSVDDLQLKRRMAHVRCTVVEPKGKPPMRQERTKGGKSRNVSLSTDVCRRLSEQLQWRSRALGGLGGAHGLMVCCDINGGCLRPSSLSRSFTAMAQELGLPKGTTFHTLRHTHATFLIAGGVDMRTVQERLGHARVATTLELYAHVVPGRDAAAADAFSEMSERMA